MKIITDKVKKIDDLYGSIKKYLGKILLLDKNSEIDGSIVAIDKLLSKCKNTRGIDTNFDIAEIFSLWGSINEINYNIKGIIHTLDFLSVKYQKRFLLDVSDDDLETFNNNFIHIKVIFNKYSADSDTDIIKELDLLINKQLDAKNTVKNIDRLTDIIINNIHAISLYTFIMQTIINECLSDTLTKGINLCDYIINKVESVKSHVILNGIKLENIPKNMISSNPRLKSFGLTPKQNSIPLSEIMKQVFKTKGGSPNNATGGAAVNLSAIANKEKVCIVMLSSVIKNPIEFDIWRLVEWESAKPFIQSPEMGISQKVVDRTSTINYVKHDAGKSWNFKIDYYGSIDSEYVVVIEKISDKNYRLFSIYDEMPIIGREVSGRVLGGGVQKIKINKSKIPEFMEYVKNKGMYKSPSRIIEYNNIHERKIVDNMFLPIKFDIKDINIQSQVVDTTYVRHELTSQLLAEFDTIITKKFKNGDAVKNNKDFGQIIHNPNFTDIFNGILVEQYKVYTFKNNNTNEFPPAETMQTFLMDLFYLNGQFNRKIHDAFVATEIDKSIYEGKGITKKIKLRQIFTDILNAIIKTIISDKNNIYQSLLYKNALLKLQIIN